MASPAQIAANRLNAQKSTGPKSPEGKSVSRFNALKSGIDAKSLVIPGEDPAELEALAANYHRQFHPSSPLQQFLVDALIHGDWQLRRLRKLEAELWDREMSLGDDPFSTRLLRLTRRIDSAERSYYRALKELQRQAAAASESDAAEDAIPAPAGRPQPWSSPETEIGFVPPPEVCPRAAGSGREAACPGSDAAARAASSIGHPALRL
jgi:hypothetical protein